MIILIGGESHTGKTFLAQRLLERYSFPYFSLDHLKMGLIRGLADCGFTAESPDALISEKMWRIVEGIVVTCVENGQNLIIEGCYLPPERVRLLLSDEVVAVYLGAFGRPISPKISTPFGNTKTSWNIGSFPRTGLSRRLSREMRGFGRRAPRGGFPISRREKHTKKCRKTQSPFSTERRAWRGGNE